MLGELEALLEGWLADCCTCRGVSEAKHRATCPVSSVDALGMADLLHRVLDWADEYAEDQVWKAIEAATQ